MSTDWGLRPFPPWKSVVVNRREGHSSITYKAVGIAADVRDLRALAIVLRSHPLLHPAEGQLSREILAEAAAVGLRVLYLSPKGPIDPSDRASADRLRHLAGDPWRKGAQAGRHGWDHDPARS